MSRFLGFEHPFDQSLLAVMLQRAWQGVAGVVTIWIIAHYLSLADQGWYYAFLGLAACPLKSDSP